MEDAKILFEANRFPTACSIGILAIEEIGKLPILRRMAIAENTEHWKICWRDFSDHLQKSQHWIIPFLVKNAPSFEEFSDQFYQGRDADLMNSLKQLGFYAGCYGRAHWADPKNIVEKEQASLVIHSANVLLAGSQPSELDVPSALNAWANHMKGCFSCDPGIANNGVVEFLKKVKPEKTDRDDGGISPKVAFEFMSTVIYISNENF